ncbi:1,5-anhydro-D-fructose reductase-like isoform X1 [Pogonomyrmex barbatus]|uniref:1,5-anhydro-D-fructose reductase-like isoform X1 n=1 Tax=Pogonomyrmex barbatus TaxID=144034 RepID=A0A6I9XAA9_9HYME|nr:1,5-anhydro-D-fructose reductase-like isoform X1 [Pogonomyrmex barbatus]XP_011641647.1 1,5-anhydro-D-fructose reductase-like isoform X1 [Pogonomyrmex barbatus]XP_011641648.1 1,5-anhydro-D-fructose reductase-like isoform X1 [Pogonomyrmex barbatus]XP_011641649.1 1,5-anhydro-D-fructose reductase-like isoform X1 [Pogonomyrmex barbatus]
MANIPTVTFSNGYKMPMLGLGTYKMGDVKRAVKDAIDLGYRHIDTAFFYGNEKEIGEAVREKIEDGTVTREDVFITTKLWNNFHKEELVVPACKQSLANLGLDYIDLFLVHWPFAFKEGDNLLPLDSSKNLVESDTDYLETWRGMEECVHQGLTRSIGISNYNSEQIVRLLKSAKIAPVNNQIEVNINVNQEKLVDFCKKHHITVTGYSPLRQPGNSSDIDKLNNSLMLKLAEKYKKTPAQIALRYVYQHGVAVIPKSVTKSRIKENMEIFDFTLTSDEMNAIRKLGTGERIAPFTQAKNFKYYPFNIPF